MSDIEHEAPERIWAYAGSFKMWRDHQTDQPHTQTEYVRVDHIEELEAKLAKAVEALFEAIYLLDPDDEDVAKETGLYRIVTTFKELKGETDE